MTSTTLVSTVQDLHIRMEKVRREHGLDRRPAVFQAVPALCDPKCPICAGTGYVRQNPDARVGDPDFGKVEMCPTARRLTFMDKLARGEIDPRIGLTAYEIQSLHWDLIRDGLSEGHKARKAVQSAYQTGHGVVFLFGKNGQAKTLALKIAVATALSDGKRAAYANMLSVLDDIRMAFDERENKQTELVHRMEWWISLDMLAIDELDKTNSTDWARERIFQLIDTRYQRAVRQEALTVIAANYDSTDELGAYLRSRIEDNRFIQAGMVVHLNGPDGRKAVPQGWKY